METQVKERLTGAVILVALIVLLVPELLTGGPGSASPPQADAGEAATEPATRTVRIDLVDGGVRQSQPVEAGDLSARALPKPASDPEAGAAKASEPVAAKVEGGAESAAKPAAAPPIAEKPVPAVVKPAAKTAVAPTAQPAKVVSTAPGNALPVNAPQKVATASKSGWAVQLGSFASRDNAQKLVRQLKGKGYSAYVLGGGGSSGKLYRVRVGPAPDKAAASALASKLRTAGHTGSVVSQ